MDIVGHFVTDSSHDLVLSQRTISSYSKIGERVVVSGSRTGVLRFAGTVKFAPGYVPAVVAITIHSNKHCNQVVLQMGEALIVMCNSLKVGLGLTQAMERVVEGYSGPLAKEFQLVLNKVRLGQSIEEALTELGNRIQKPDVDMLVSAINILKETGGNLAETFFVMAETIRERQKMEKKIQALTAQGVMQARIISAIPFVLLAVFYFMDKEYIAPLLFKPLGWVCLTIVFVLVITGAFVMKKMVEIKV